MLNKQKNDQLKYKNDMIKIECDDNIYLQMGGAQNNTHTK